MTDPIILKDFQNAVAQSPHLGHALMRNIDIETFPGAMKSQRKTMSMVNGITTQTFTVTTSLQSPPDQGTAAGDLRTQAEIDQGNNFTYAAVTFSTTGTLPSVDFGGGAAPLVAGTVYFLIYISNTKFYIADTLAHAMGSINGSISTVGSGVHTMTMVPYGTVNWIVNDVGNTNYYYELDTNGRVWHSRGGNVLYLLTGNTLTASAGNGLVLFRNSDGSKVFLFVYRNALIDIVDVTSDTTLNSPSWTTGFKTMNSGSGSGNSHFSIVGQDNIIYYCDDRYVGSIMEIAGQVFDPTNAATYTFTSKALTLPQKEIAYCLEELGINLLTGGLTFNKIYPWDRVSASFNLPLSVPENGIYRMKNAGSVVYILAGVKGNVYSTQGTYVRFFQQIPGYVANNAANLPYVVSWGGMAIRSGAILVGFLALTSGNSGVYILYPDGRVLQDNTPYTGSANVPAIYALNDSYVIGYAGGSDFLLSTRPTAGTFTSVYQSQLFRVADKTHKGKLSQVQAKMAKPASSGQIRVSYRRDTSSSWTVMATYVCDGTQTSFQTDYTILDIVDVQFQVEFDSLVELTEVAITP